MARKGAHRTDGEGDGGEQVVPGRAGRSVMSMYSQLLAASLAATAGATAVAGSGAPALPGARSQERGAALVRRLADCRRRLEPLRAGGGPRPGDPGPRAALVADAPADLARQVEYDLVLVELCRHHGIECGAGGFSHPAEERRRLEAALVAAGIDLGSEP